MRYAILVFITSIITITAKGQQAVSFLLADSINIPIQQSGNTALNSRITSGGGSRWYNFADMQATALGPGNYGYELPFLWYDTSAQNIQAGTLQRNHLLSYASILHPQHIDFNDPVRFYGQIGVTNSYPYSIDSVEFYGYYGRNPLINDTDTIVLSIVYGTGTFRSNVSSFMFNTGSPPDHSSFPYPQYGLDTLWFLSLWHDSTNNRAYDTTFTGIHTGHTPIVINVKLGPANVNDTDANGYFHKKIALLTPMVVPAGNFTGISITFKSGDPTAPHMPPGSPGFNDTVFTGVPGNSYKHSMFRPLVLYKKTAGVTNYPVYTYGNWNNAAYKIQPLPGWAGIYTPKWILDSSGAPSRLQDPVVGFHIVCPSCDLLPFHIPLPDEVSDLRNNDNAIAYPNPANNQLTISFSLSIADDVTITLTNILGQVVAQRYIINEKDHKEVLNTTLLPDGMYIYNVATKNESYTGHISVLHQ